MSNNGNNLWTERTAAIALLLGVVVFILGVGIAVELRAVVAGACISLVGVLVGVAAFLAYRM